MGGAELGEGGAEGVFAGLLDAGLEKVDRLEKNGGEDAGAETSYEVKGCLVGRGLKLARRSQRSQRLRWKIRTGDILDFVPDLREPSDMVAQRLADELDAPLCSVGEKMTTEREGSV